MIKRLIQVIFIFILLVYSGGLYAAGKYKFVKMWPEGQGYILSPADIAIDEDNYVYVINDNLLLESPFPVVMKFDKSGNFITGWGKCGPGNDEFMDPSSIVVNKGFVYIADPSKEKVLKFSTNGKFVLAWVMPSYPNKLAMDTEGNVYVRCKGIVNKFTGEGVPVATFNTLNIIGEDFTIDHEDNIWVIGGGLPVREYNKQGKLVQTWDERHELSKNDETLEQTSITIDENKNIYIVYGFSTEYDQTCFIQKFDANGLLLQQIGKYGSNDGEFDEPKGITVDTFGNIWVADTYNNRIQKINPKGKFQTKWQNPDGSMIGPSSIYIDNFDHVFVIDRIKAAGYDDATRIQQFSSEGNYISKWIDENSGSNRDSHKSSVLAIDRKGILYRIGMEHQYGKSWMEIDTQISLIPLVSSSVSYDNIPLPQGFMIGWIGIDSKDDLILFASSINTDFSEDGRVGLEGLGGEESKSFLIKIDKSGKIIWKKQIKDGHPILDKTGNFYIIDIKGISKYSAEGVLLKSIDCNLSVKNISDIAVDSKENIYLTDVENNCVLKLDAEGKELTRWGQAGLGKGEFNHPTGIGVDSKGNVYVADTDNHRVQKFALVQ